MLRDGAAGAASLLSASTTETEPLLLGLDIGTSRTKALLVDAGGHRVAHAAVPTPFASAGGRIEMEVDALRCAVGEVLAGLGDDRRRVVAAGVTGIAESGAPLDASGRALAPVIAWHDPRGHDVVRRLHDRFGPDFALRTGEALRPVATVVKLAWLLEHGVSGVHRWLGVPELALHALTGTTATEHSLAARTGCYDVTTGEWIDDVADAAGFGAEVFPGTRPAGEVMGLLTAGGAAWSGLPVGIPVTIAGHDHLVGMAGAGVRRGEVANSVGTAETLVARSAALPDIAKARAASVAVRVHPGGTEWALLVSAARAGLVLDAAAVALGRSPQDLDRLAAGSVPVDACAIVDSLAVGRPVELPAGTGGEVWAGILEALAARTANAFHRMVGMLGPVSRVVVFGGGSVSEPWLRAKAAALPVPVVGSPVASAAARGAALYAGVAAGWWPSVGEAPAP